MYRLYAAPGAGSFAPLAVLEAAGASYELVAVDLSRPRSSRTAFHPFGWVPSLELPDGERLIESAAIVQYLGDVFPETGLAPPSGTPARARYYQWLAYMATNLYIAYAHINHPDRFAADPRCHRAMAERAREQLTEQWQVIERALRARPWLTGDTLSAADIYMSMLTTWDDAPDQLAARCPNVARARVAVAGQPFVRRAAAREQELTGV